MSLTVWNHVTDLYDHEQLAGNFSKIDQHDHSSGKGLQIPTGGIADGAVTGAKLSADTITAGKIAEGAVGSSEIQDGAVGAAEIADDSITEEEILDTFLDKLGVTDSEAIRRGKSIITGEGTRTDTAFGALGGTAPGPDQVSNIVLPTDGVIFVAFHALWNESVANTARAGLFMDSTQVAAGNLNTHTLAESTVNGSSGVPNIWLPLVSSPGLGLASGLSGTIITHADTVTTGMLVGGPQPNAHGMGGVCAIFAAANTYDIAIQFKASSGTVTVKERKLWVWTMDF